MGKLIVTEFMTLDGVAQAPGGPDEDRDSGFTHGGWQAPLLDQSSGDAMFEQASHMDALLLGRKTYEIFADYWPHAPEEVPFTALLNDVPKYVASRTLSEPLAWKGSTLLAGDLTADHHRPEGPPRGDPRDRQPRSRAVTAPVGPRRPAEPLGVPAAPRHRQAGLRWRNGADGAAPHRVGQLPERRRAAHVRQRR